MTKKLQGSLKQQKKSTRREKLRISGTLGIPLSGLQRVEVPNRNSFVFVKLRDNQSEVIQAYNNKVASSYGLPVIVEWHSGRYVVVDVDTARYQNNWNSFAPFLPRHGNTHSFDLANGGGGDITWVQSRQFMPSLVLPSGTLGAPNVVVSSYTLRNEVGTWKYVGDTGTQSFQPYKPPTGTQAVMALVYLDSVSGNPMLMVGSGSYFAATITGSAQITPFIPAVTNPAHIPLAAIRLVTGTSTISWSNIYDVRQFLHPVSTGTGGGAGGITNITGSVAGLANKVVLTSSSGSLYTDPSLAWGLSSGKLFLEFGANVAKEANAGRMGYQLFDEMLDIVGAGTGTPRWVRIYDNLKVGTTQTDGFQLLGLPSSWIYLNATGTAVGPIQAPELTFVTGTDRLLGMRGTDFDSRQFSVATLANAIITTETLGTFTNGGTVQATGTFSVCPWKDTLNATTNSLPWPESGLMTTLTIRTSTTQPASGSLTCTLVVDNVATSLVATVPAGGGAGSYTDSTRQVSFSANSVIRWDVRNNGTAASAQITGITMLLSKRSIA